jgi:hypothetical protein
MKKHSGYRLDRWFPQILLPREIWIVPAANDLHEDMVLESASGLAALAVRRGHGSH